MQLTLAIITLGNKPKNISPPYPAPLAWGVGITKYITRFSYIRKDEH